MYEFAPLFVRASPHVLLLLRARDDDHGHAPGPFLRAKAAEHLESVYARQAEVEQDEVERGIRGRALQRFLSRHRLFDRDFVAEGVLQEPPDHPAVGAVVLDEQDPTGPLDRSRRFSPFPFTTPNS